jgi:hypothetical protein
MKRCAVFFALLILTLVIAIQTENRANALPLEEVAIDGGNSMARQEVRAVLPDKGMPE